MYDPAADSTLPSVPKKRKFDEEETAPPSKKVKTEAGAEAAVASDSSVKKKKKKKGQTEETADTSMDISATGQLIDSLVSVLIILSGIVIHVVMFQILQHQSVRRRRKRRRNLMTVQQMLIPV